MNLFQMIRQAFATMMAAQMNTLPPPSWRSRSYNKTDHTRVKGKDYPQHGKRECDRRVAQMLEADERMLGGYAHV